MISGPLKILLDFFYPVKESRIQPPVWGNVPHPSLPWIKNNNHLRVFLCVPPRKHVLDPGMAPLQNPGKVYDTFTVVNEPWVTQEGKGRGGLEGVIIVTEKKMATGVKRSRTVYLSARKHFRMFVVRALVGRG